MPSKAKLAQPLPRRRAAVELCSADDSAESKARQEKLKEEALGLLRPIDAALHRAAEASRAKVAGELLAQGADPFALAVYPGSPAFNCAFRTAALRCDEELCELFFRLPDIPKSKLFEEALAHCAANVRWGSASAKAIATKILSLDLCESFERALAICADDAWAIEAARQLSGRFDPERAKASGGYPLHAFALGSSPSQETAEALAGLGVPLDQPDADGLTPMMIAAGHGKTEAFRALALAGADPLARSPAGARASDYACGAGRPALASALRILEQAAEARGGKLSPADFEAAFGTQDFIESWMLGNADKPCPQLGRAAGAALDPCLPPGENSDRRQLLDACLAGDAALAERLLQNGADPDSCDFLGNSAAYFAALSGSPETLKTVLAHGAILKFENLCHAFGKQPGSELYGARDPAEIAFAKNYLPSLHILAAYGYPFADECSNPTEAAKFAHTPEALDFLAAQDISFAPAPDSPNRTPFEIATALLPQRKTCADEQAVRAVCERILSDAPHPGLAGVTGYAFDALNFFGYESYARELLFRIAESGTDFAKPPPFSPSSRRSYCDEIKKAGWTQGAQLAMELALARSERLAFQAALADSEAAHALRKPKSI